MVSTYRKCRRFSALILCVLVVTLLSCISRDGDIKPRSNPFDPGYIQPVNRSTTKFIDISRLWSDFSFIDTTGSVCCSLKSNFEYFTLYYGENVDSLKLLSGKAIGVFNLSGLDVKHTYHYKFTGYYRNGDTAAESFIDSTPAGMPPHTPNDLQGQGTLYGAFIKWSGIDGVKEYKLRRTDSTGTSVIVQTIKENYIKDSFTDYSLFTYRIGLSNEYGTAYSQEKVTIQKISSIAAPVNCSASKGLYPDRILISWDKIASAGMYKLYRSMTADGEFLIVKVLSDTSYRDNIDKKGNVFYKLASVDDSGHTGVSTVAFSGFITDSLSVPKNVFATKDDPLNKIRVTWSSVISARSYNVYRSSDSLGVYTLTGTVTGSANLFIDSSVTIVKNYYKVSAVDSNGIETRLSQYAEGTVQDLPIPAHITASEGTNISKIQVNWDTVPGKPLYFVYRSNKIDSAFACICSTTTNSYIDSVGIDITKYYKISYRLKKIESGQSSAVMGWTLSFKAPGNLTASLGTYSTHVLLQWQSIAGVTGYIVYRSIYSNGPFVAIDTTSETKYADSTAPNTDYFYYRVSAIFPGPVNGPLSGSTQGFINSVGRPSGLVSPVLHPAKIYLKWNKVNSAEYYILYRSNSASGSYAAIDTVKDTAAVDHSLPAGVSSGYYKVAAGIRTRVGLQSSYLYATLFSPPSSVLSYNLVNGAYLSWSNPQTAKYFKVYRSIDTTDNFKCIDSTINNYYTDTIITFNHTYYYRLTAVGDSGESKPSYAVSLRFTAGPALLTATVMHDSVKLVWTPVASISMYYIYRSQYADSGFTQYGSAYDTTYTDIYITKSAKYYYYVKGLVASNQYTSSSPVANATVTAKPQSPINVSAQSGTGYVKLNWSADIIGGTPTSYIVYRSSDYYSSYTPLDTVTVTTLNDSLSNTSTWYYKISAVNSSGQSAQSSYVSSYALAPSAPVVVSASTDTYGSGVKFVWKKSASATNYIITRATYSGSTKTILDTITDTTFFDTTCYSGSYYYYSVRSILSNKLVSAYSTELTGRRLAPPSSIYVTGTPTHILIQWNSISSTADIKYIIFRSKTSNGPYDRIDTTTQNSYYDTVSSLDYYYYKTASLNIDESSLSSENSGKLTSPSAPTMISATKGQPSVVKVTWRSSVGSTSYKVYRSSSSSMSPIVLVTTVTDTFCTDSVPSDSTYYYKVKGTSIAGDGSLSTYSVYGYREPTSAPSKPRLLDASTTSGSYIYLSWSAPLGGAQVSQYKIYRAEDSLGTYAAIDSLTNTYFYDYVSKTYPDMYYYFITAKNAAGESTPSDTVSGTRQ